jgi:hypothetical protein
LLDQEVAKGQHGGRLAAVVGADEQRLFAVEIDAGRPELAKILNLYAFYSHQYPRTKGKHLNRRPY